MVYFSAREMKASSSSVLSAVALAITRMAGALSCPSKHISAHFCDLGFSPTVFYFAWYRWFLTAVHLMFTLLINFSYTRHEEMLVYISSWIDMMINVILNTLNLVWFRIFPGLVLFKKVDIFCSFHEKCYHWDLGLLRMIYKLLC